MKLTIVEDGNRSEIQFDGQTVTVGRAVDNDIRVEDTLVSRHHCRIERTPEGPTLIDMGSSNGTQVNGERVERQCLTHGDQVQVGAAQIWLELEAQDSIGFESETAGFRTVTEESERMLRNLRVLARITRRLTREAELMPLLALIVDSAVALVGGERGFLLLGEREGGDEGAVFSPKDLTVRVARTFEGADIPIPSSRVSQGVTGGVLENGSPVLSVDAGRDMRFDGMQSVEDLRLRSVMCLPITLLGCTDGVLFLDNRLQSGAFSKEDLELAALFADQASIAILNARRVGELRERNARLEQSRHQVEKLNDQLGRKVRDRDSELAVVRAELGRERGRYDYTSLVGASAGMRKVFQQLDRIIESKLPVLIQGESGTGKELIARAIHFNGERKSMPFVSENCAALPDSLLESELFGHERGAFTGAHRKKKGLLERAHGGTLFLDEIGDMSVEMQKKLLRALQEGEFRPLGSDSLVQTDVRILTASHRNLEDLVRDGEFREDLYYRVNVLSVRLPALRERSDDIPLLAEHLLARSAREAGCSVPILPHEVMAALVAHAWPGNVRELENEMRRLTVLAQETVKLEDLSQSVLEGRSLHTQSAVAKLSGDAADIKMAVAELEKSSIQAALARTGGNKSKAASELGISRFALQRKLEKYGLTKKKPATAEQATQDATDAIEE